ncbi:unnamed protein product [Allacma fusca]|uniref:Uncharacterized protein n=1 Tax=Allacma fusca TaxID=39272 RepID=A0A8J2PC46_9HEXA|nr:unnamed protein product [Allacma fusca]
MPTNLKSLLSRPRSRNELKFREKEDNEGSSVSESGDGEEGNDNRSHSADCSRAHAAPTHSITCCTNYEDGVPSSGRTPTSKNFFSCSALPALGLVTERDFCPSPDGNSSTNDKSFGDLAPPSENKSSSGGSMRKCNTVLALSRLSTSPSFTTTASTPSSPMGPGGEFPPIEDPGSLSASRVRMMRDRLYSASSSTLNNLINSSSGRTTKLLSGWKLPKNSTPGNNNGSSSGTSPVGVGGGSSCGKEHHETDSHCMGGSSNGTPGIISPFNGFFSAFKSRSQVSVVEGSTSTFGISTSPAMPVTPVNRLRRNFSAVNSAHLLNYNSSNNLQVCGPCSRSSSFNSFRSWREEKSVEVFCRLCLSNFTMEETSQVQACSCRYCKDVSNYSYSVSMNVHKYYNS